MKPLTTALLTLAAMMLVASAALAYVQPGHLPQTPTNTTTPVIGDDQNAAPLPNVVNDPTVSFDRRGGRGGHHPPRGDRPTNPVPEPGTMMLASMGLIALGVSLRRRHR